MSSPSKVDTRVTVETPEGVDFQFVIAGPGKRGMSFLIDTILKLAVIAVAGVLVGVFSVFEAAGVGAGVFLLTWFLMSWLYGACCETFLNGQTLGKKSQHLRVVRTNGTPIGWFEAFGRNLLLFADGMLVLGPLALNTVGLVTMSCNRRMQRLGDLVFDTMVIDETREYISRAAEVTYGIDRLKRSDCHGRFSVPERTLAVIERLFEGDRLISDGRREEIARNVAEALRKRLGYSDAGPDAANPNVYFAQSGLKQTMFLKQVLKTFADDPDGAASQSGDSDSTDASEHKSEGALASPVPVTGDTMFAPTDELQLSQERATEQASGLPDDWRQA